MKRPQPDIGDILKGSFIANVGGVRKLKRLWGTTNVNGVEVLNRRQYYFPPADQSPNYEKLFRYLGAYNSVEGQDYRGIRQAWVYFNKNAVSDLPTDYNDFVAENLNKMWWDYNDGSLPDLTLTTSIVIEAAIDATMTKEDLSVAVTDILNPNMTPEVLKAAVINNYETLWDTCLISQQGLGVLNKGSIIDPVTERITPDTDDLVADDPWLQTVARYALRDNGIPCTVKEVTNGLGKTSEGRLYYTYIVELEIPYHTFNAQTLFVSSIVQDLLATYTQTNSNSLLSYPNGFYTQKAIKNINSLDLEDDITVVTRAYRLWEDEATAASALYENIWYQFENVWYLRADAFQNPRAYGLTYKELNTYVSQLLQSDFKKKKTSWWKKFVAAVIFVIAVYFSLPTGGTSLNAAAWAAAIVTASLAITVLTLAFSAMGMHEWASAFAEVNKTVEPLVTVASIYLAVSGVMATYEKAKTAAEEAAKDAAKKAAAGAAGDAVKEAATEAVEEAATEAAKEAAADAAKDAAKEGAKDVVADVAKDAVKEISISYSDILFQAIKDTADKIVQEITKGYIDIAAGSYFTNSAMKFVTQIVRAFNIGASIYLDTLQSRNQDLKAEYEKYIEETYQESDVLAMFMNVYAKPATADWSMYASLYDLPYERSGGNLSIGNIQRTTKQALRKADYNDPAFANILIL